MENSSQVSISSMDVADLPAPKTGTRLKIGSLPTLVLWFTSAKSLNTLLKIDDSVPRETAKLDVTYILNVCRKVYRRIR